MNQQLRDYLSQLADQQTPKNCLPNQFYQDEQSHREEMKVLFARQWAAVEFAHAIPEPGDAKPVEFAGAPLLLVRTKEGAVKVYQNVCRHRGMILVEEPTKLQSVITCPYHGWCYGLDGRLRGTPMVGGHTENSHPDIKRDELGLLEVPSHVEFGTIFVNLDGNAAPFAEHFGELHEKWSEFIGRPTIFAGPESEFNLTVKGNWKLAVENYLDSYHLPFIHPGLNSYSPVQEHYDYVGSNFAGQGSNAFRRAVGDGDRTFPLYPGLADKWLKGAEYPCLYPNLLLGLHCDHIFCMILMPLDHLTTLEKTAIFYADDQAKTAEYQDMRQEAANGWKEVFQEDIGVVEGMQRGRLAPDFDGGRLSPVMDGATHAFHKWAARELVSTA